MSGDTTTDLLEGAPAAAERRPERRWAYPLAAMILISGYIAYHALVLLVSNTPGKGLAVDFHKSILDKTRGRRYFQATGNQQSWNMFAPNPNRSNVFLRVLVEDQDGQIWDLKHDIHGVDRHPYVMYDRIGKITRRIDGKKPLQRYYAAWVCRQWEREHDGEQAKSVSFVKRFTRVPEPKEVVAKWTWDPRTWRGYDPWELDYKQTEQETISCKTTANAQLPPHLREKYGFEPHPEGGFKAVRARTWWSKKEAEEEADRRGAERAARYEELEEPAEGESGEESPDQ